jgi:hypothetical protein
MTHRQALQDFPDTSQVSLHKNNKIDLPPLKKGAENDVPVTVAYRFISERTVLQKDSKELTRSSGKN